MPNAKGYATLQIGEEEYRLRLGFNEIADADEFMGRSIIQAMIDDPMNHHILRVLFYFGTREQNKKINTVKAAGRVMGDGDVEEISQMLMDSMKSSGVLKEGDSGEA